MNKKIKKEQFLIGALIGVFLLVILIPVPKENEEGISVEVSEESEKVQEFDILEKQLKEILQKISGVGQVEVFITYKDNGKIVVEKDIAVSEEQIQEAVKNLPILSQEEKTGIVIIALFLNKEEDRGTYQFVVFNTKTREIIEQWTNSGKALGIGLKNYWGMSVYNAIKKIK